VSHGYAELSVDWVSEQLLRHQRGLHHNTGHGPGTGWVLSQRTELRWQRGVLSGRGYAVSGHAGWWVLYTGVCVSGRRM
jgi:hypothetical protein